MEKNILQLEGEIWRDIPNYEGLYQISNYGRVKALARKFRKRLNYNPWANDRIRSGNKGRYLHINLSKDGVTKTVVIHRLVAELFIPNPNNKPHINHKDCDRHNNRSDNLEWCTHAENEKHALDHGLKPRGDRISKNGLCESDIREIRAIYDSTKCTMRFLADKFHVTNGCISPIVRRITWKWVE